MSNNDTRKPTRTEGAQTKPREFWVYEDNGELWVSESNWNDPASVHVIEYDAYLILYELINGRAK